MEKELFGKQLGEFVKVELNFKDASLVAEVSVSAFTIVDMLAAKVKAAIPGQIDDAIIDLFVATAKAELAKAEPVKV